MKFKWIVIGALVSSMGFTCQLMAQNSIIRIGMIGLDTSHCPAFTKMFNDSTADGYVPDARVVCAFPGGSPDVSASYTRVEKFTRQLQEEYGVEIVESIPELVNKVDAVILTSVDGRPHLEQAKPIIAAGKPIFIDKPMAGSYQDVREIFRLANEANVPCFSSSSLRFFDNLQKAIADTSMGRIMGAHVFAPCRLEMRHPDFFWYGIHGVEMLFAVMGPECVSVSRVSTEGTDVATGIWMDGRLGTFRGIREGKYGYGVTLFYEKGNRHVVPEGGSLYENLVREIVKFFKTGNSPVDQKETLAMFAFMEAADKSKVKGGKIVFLEQ
jgi:hypothetical protein